MYQKEDISFLNNAFEVLKKLDILNASIYCFTYISIFIYYRTHYF